MGRLVKHRQTIDTQNYNLEYGYNLAGQLTSEKYPSGKIVTNGYDANGRMTSVADPSRTYLSGMQYLGKGNAVRAATVAALFPCAICALLAAKNVVSLGVVGFESGPV